MPIRPFCAAPRFLAGGTMGKSFIAGTLLLASTLMLSSVAATQLSVPVTIASRSAEAQRADAIFVEIAPGEVTYFSTAERLKGGRPAAPERLTVRFEHPLKIMRRHVSQAEYAQCVRDDACRPLDNGARELTADDMPVVGVSWQDATDYARWYSLQKGEHYRLPTYEEWVYAAGEAFKEDLRLDIYDSDNPAELWLAEYALEAQRRLANDPHPRPFGSFGENAAGIQDIGGNVWEWTDTCHVRMYLDSHGEQVLPPNENCGVRVVAGSHPTLITDFMRDPKAGACSVGLPPANLGIRLVRDSMN